MLLSQPVWAAISTVTSITVRWTAPGDDGKTGRATTYDLRYSKTPITDANWTSATQAVSEPRPATAGTVQSCTISGLVPTTTYYFRLKTIDDRGNASNLSNQATAATCGGSCTGVVGNCDCSADGSVDILDLSVLTAYLFQNVQPTCWCIYEANIDNSAPTASGPTIDINDLTMFIDYLFGRFTPLQTCK